ncbi:MAG TPA: SMC-Scp complex subunit ScpB [Acidobacteriaceae bacterium]|jgi:segregation and condensation protein B|nr:SMC-Scp complex subunit ScpB [Acidobacteriaceae bacterium]
MSLKARIEAVIYAAEEPVTLQQLAALFRDEVLLTRNAEVAPEAPAEGELEAATQLDIGDGGPEHGPEPEPGESETAPNPAVTETLAPDVPPIPSAHEEPPSAAATPIAELADSPVTDSFPDGLPASSEAAAEASAERPAAPPAANAVLEDEKKAARARDREVRDEIRAIVDELIADYNAADRGLEIREVAGGFRMATRAEYHDTVRAFVRSLKPPMKLSLQALETLAVIAYKQPVTAPEIGDIRGVDSAGVLGSLIARKLITTAGRKQVIGRPILYKTTREFLLRFGLKDINELPSMEEFEKMAIDLAESDLAESDLADSDLPAPASAQLAFPDPSPVDEEIPFAQNEIADLEEAAPEEPAPATGESAS